ncbi:MAG: hypothetical protein ABMA01_09300 [Chthoniobacteraceae bacterium]
MISILAGVLFLGLVLMVYELWTAPEGFQDEDGFHVVDSSRRTTANSRIGRGAAMRASH